MGKVKHGDSPESGCTTEYRIWLNMRSRCNNPKNAAYRLYGQRGISVCDRWDTSYAAFLADMGRRPSMAHSLDRIDNDGPYSLENCRWATQIQQANNVRSNIRIAFDGRVQSASEWARTIGVSANTIQRRIKKGWTPERALTEAPREQAHRVDTCKHGHGLTDNNAYIDRRGYRNCRKCRAANQRRYKWAAHRIHKHGKGAK